MLADQLIARAQRCAELNRMLADNAGHEDAPDWISEISTKALNRKEERHVAIVRQVNHLHGRITAAQAITTKDDTDRIAALEARKEVEPERAARFDFKIKILRGRVAEREVRIATEMGKISILQHRIEQFMNSPELITKEDLIDG